MYISNGVGLTWVIGLDCKHNYLGGKPSKAVKFLTDLSCCVWFSKQLNFLVFFLICVVGNERMKNMWVEGVS